MKIFKSLLAGVAFVASTAALATTVLPGNGSEPSLQQVIDSLYQSAACPTCTAVSNAPDVNANQLAEAGQFQIEASGGSVATMIIELAGNANTNTFGIYDLVDPTKTLQLFSGIAGAGGQVLLSVDSSFNFAVNFGAGGTAQFASSAFGYYIGNGSGPMFYSQASLNGGNDQMVAYKGNGTDKIKLPTRPSGIWGSSSDILAWEDLSLSAGSDQDYQDMVVYVESVTAVPEPGSMALLGLGLVGLAAFARRKQRA